MFLLLASCVDSVVSSGLVAHVRLVVDLGTGAVESVIEMDVRVG